MDDVSKQPSLLPPEQLAERVFFEKLERTTGDYTAERLRTKRPEDYQLVVTMLARGFGSQKIEDTFHAAGMKLSKNTVKAVRMVEGETIDLLRERLAKDCLESADIYLEAGRLIVEEIMSNKFRREKLTARDAQSLLVSAGIAVQNGQLLAGLPTSRVSIEEIRRPDHDDFSRMLAALPSANVPPTHSLGETGGEKGASVDEALAATQGAGMGVPDVRTTRPTDFQSADKPTKDQ